MVLLDGLAKTFLVSHLCLLALHGGEFRRLSCCNREGRSRCKEENIGGSGVGSHQCGSLFGGLYWSQVASAGRRGVWARARDALCVGGANSFLQNNVLDTFRAPALRLCNVLFGGFSLHVEPYVVFEPPLALRA